MNSFKMYIKQSNQWKFVGEGEGEGGTGGTPPPKTFTQDEVNSFLAEDRRKHKVQTEKLINDLEGLKTSRGLSEKEKNELQTRIEELNQQVMTKEQLAEKEKKRLGDE